MIYCFWDEQPKKLVGPVWISVKNDSQGYVDRAFDGWYDPVRFRPLGEEQLNRLLVAYIDDMRTASRHEVLSILETSLSPNTSNDNSVREEED
jgi:hypothetical protein